MKSKWIRFLEKHGPNYYRKCQTKIIRKTGNPVSLQILQELCRTAYEVGLTIPLEGTNYGPAHWLPEQEVLITPAYYHFLAGFVRQQNISSIIEVGTWYGGSTLALHHGFSGKGEMVTIDINLHNPGALQNYPNITRLTGDAASQTIAEQIRTVFPTSVDLLYLDGDHRFESNQRIIHLYGQLFKPKWIILDDIHWQWSMEKLWVRILKNHAAFAFDAGSNLGFRKGNGFGIVDFRARDNYTI